MFPCYLTFISCVCVAKLLPVWSFQFFLWYLLIVTNFNVIKFAFIACDIKYFNKKSFSSPRSQTVILCSIQGSIFPMYGIIQQIYFFPQYLGSCPNNISWTSHVFLTSLQHLLCYKSKSHSCVYFFGGYPFTQLFLYVRSTLIVFQLLQLHNKSHLIG